MEALSVGVIDERTGLPVAADHGDLTTHPNNPFAKAAE